MLAYNRNDYFEFEGVLLVNYPRSFHPAQHQHKNLYQSAYWQKRRSAHLPKMPSRARDQIQTSGYALACFECCLSLGDAMLPLQHLSLKCNAPKINRNRICYFKPRLRQRRQRRSGHGLLHLCQKGGLPLQALILPRSQRNKDSKGNNGESRKPPKGLKMQAHIKSLLYPNFRLGPQPYALRLYALAHYWPIGD